MEQNKNIDVGIVFQVLRGTWAFDRAIEGHGSMKGTAHFCSAFPETLDYDESGIHAAKGGAVDFYQSYMYVRQDGDILVTFKDGRPFHRLAFHRSPENLLTATAVHLCGDDVYSGQYVFRDNDNFSLCWDVKGPRKDYMIETTYIRQATC